MDNWWEQLEKQLTDEFEAFGRMYGFCEPEIRFREWYSTQVFITRKGHALLMDISTEYDDVILYVVRLRHGEMPRSYTPGYPDGSWFRKPVTELYGMELTQDNYGEGWETREYKEKRFPRRLKTQLDMIRRDPGVLLEFMDSLGESDVQVRVVEKLSTKEVSVTERKHTMPEITDGFSGMNFVGKEKWKKKK